MWNAARGRFHCIRVGRLTYMYCTCIHAYYSGIMYYTPIDTQLLLSTHG